MYKIIDGILSSPWLDLFIFAVLLIACAGKIIEDFETGNIGAHHGVAVLGFVHLLKFISAMHQSVKKIRESEDT